LLLERLNELGLVSGRRRQRTDSTHVLAAVRDLNRLEFVGETLRAALEAVAVTAPEWLTSWMPRARQEQYGARVGSYRLPSDESERTQLTWRIAVAGYQFLETAIGATAPAWLRQVPAVGILRTVWLQQFQRTITERGKCPGEGGTTSRPAEHGITSPYGGNAVKRSSAWDGYKVHLSETCDAQTGRPYLITHVVTTDAPVGDPVVVDEIHDRLDAKGPLPGEHLMDAGCVSAQLLLTAPSQLHV
jgi:hypothetical protein